MGRLHPNVIKVRKQKRMRRAYLKPFSAEFIKVSRNINKDTPVKVDGLDYSAMYDYRARGTTYWDTYLDAIFGFTKNQPVMFSKQRLLALKRLNELTNEVSPECNVVVQRGGITKTILRFYFATDFSVCFFMKEYTLERYMLKSSTFHGDGCRDRAYFALNNNRLEWVERIEFPTVAPDAPSG